MHDEAVSSRSSANCSQCRHRAVRSVPRRHVLAGLATGTMLAITGCSQLGDGSATPADSVPEPVSLSSEHDCDVCGMIVPNHPGPTAEIFYPDHEPSGHDNPARFCSTWEAFQYDFERQDEGWQRSVMYVTDYSSVEYRTMDEGGDTIISTHPEAEAFARAATVTFVAGSRVKGAMGRDLLAFSADDDASAFADEHGGDLVTVDEVTPELIAQLAQA